MQDIKGLRGLISYDPDTGLLTWRSRKVENFKSKKEGSRWNARYAGKPALSSKSTSGHLAGTISKKHIKAHRAAWAIYFGEWPINEIDHINGNPSDNRITNLREATRTENAKNIAKKIGVSKSSFKGVSKEGNKWKAAINCDGKRTYIGLFNDEKTAAVAYDLFASTMHGDFARPNFTHDKPAIAAFVAEYVRRNHKAAAIDGVKVWQTEEAF